jgi:outer membrane protein OmpA-like peptidoglycan-associated protein
MKRSLIFVILTLFTLPVLSHANPTQTGETGLISIPTADTLDSGNVCVGVWGNISEKEDGSHAVILPVTLTLGLGSYWEAYGTYPNLLLNGQDDKSGRGTANIGTKLRILGKRNSPFKLAADAFVQRHVSNDSTVDGLTDIGTRLIASLQTDVFGYHLYAGYRFREGFMDEALGGAGIDYALTQRTRILLEAFGSVNEQLHNKTIESTLGVQYYVSPHLTFNAAGGVDLTGQSVTYRAIIGFSTCQGLGSYIKPIPVVASAGGDRAGKKQHAARPVKIVPITPLLLRSLPLSTAVSKLEVPVDPEGEEITIKPYGQIVIPSQQTVSPVALAPKFIPIRPQQTQGGLARAAKTQSAQQQVAAATPIGDIKVPRTAIQQQPSTIAAQQPAALTPVGTVATAMVPASQPASQPVEAKRPHEVTGRDVGEEVSMVPRTSADKQAAADEYTLDLLEGVTPLYGIEIKGGKPELVPIRPGQKEPESALATPPTLTGQIQPARPVAPVESETAKSPEAVRVESAQTGTPAQSQPIRTESPVTPQPAPAAQPAAQPAANQGAAAGTASAVQTGAAKVPEHMVVYRKFRFADGRFEFNMADLSDEVKRSISEAAEQIRGDKNWVYLRIDGHTDSIGSVNYNMDLSLKRAIAVASYLITKEGIDPRRIFVKGMGKTKTIADNATPEGRRLNRRFEILFLVPKVK